MYKKLYRGMIGFLFPLLLGGWIPYFLMLIKKRAALESQSFYPLLDIFQVIFLFMMFSFLSCRVVIHTMRNISQDTKLNILIGLGILFVFVVIHFMRGDLFSLGGIAFLEYLYLLYLIQKQLGGVKR